MHTADITVLRAHFRGRLVLSGDASGCWVLHQLLPPRAYKGLLSASTTKAAAPQQPAPAQIRCV